MKTLFVHPSSEVCIMLAKHLRDVDVIREGDSLVGKSYDQIIVLSQLSAFDSIDRLKWVGGLNKILTPDGRILSGSYGGCEELS